MYRKNVEDIRKELERNIDQAETLLEAWKKVSYPTKKDGKPFANMKKNFEGATYKNISVYNPDPEEMELVVYGCSKKSGYVNDSIYAYGTIEYMDKNDPRLLKKENYGREEKYHYQSYIYDLEDIKAAVNERIDFWTDCIKEYKESLKNLDTIYNRFYDSIESALNTLASDTGSDSSSAYILIRDAVKKVMR